MAKAHEKGNEGNEVEGKSVVTSAQAASRARWNATKSPAARRQRVRELSKARAARSPQEQIVLLNERLGVGMGAERERERLYTLIAQQ